MRRSVAVALTQLPSPVHSLTAISQPRFLEQFHLLHRVPFVTYSI